MDVKLRLSIAKALLTAVINRIVSIRRQAYHVVAEESRADATKPILTLTSRAGPMWTKSAMGCVRAAEVSAVSCEVAIFMGTLGYVIMMLTRPRCTMKDGSTRRTETVSL
jgi:hypothetical protein